MQSRSSAIVLDKATYVVPAQISTLPRSTIAPTLFVIPWALWHVKEEANVNATSERYTKCFSEVRFEISVDTQLEILIDQARALGQESALPLHVCM